MDTAEHSFKTSLRSIIDEIDKIKLKPSKSKEYTLRISDLEHKFDKYYEEVTPKPVLSDMYTCVGRMKFYGDKMLFLYLEISENAKFSMPWPVRATWKVELIDEDDYGITNSPFVLGEATCIFNKPKQGFISHPNDWISVSLDKITKSGLVARDNSITMRWSVITEPLLQDFYLEQFEELLKNSEKYFDFFHGGEIKQIKDGVCEITQKNKDHENKISSLETLLPRIDEKLSTIEHKQTSMDEQFKIIVGKLGNNNNITK